MKGEVRGAKYQSVTFLLYGISESSCFGFEKEVGIIA
jgi:hypothetical protein